MNRPPSREPIDLTRRHKPQDYAVPAFDTGEHALINPVFCRCGSVWGIQQHCNADRDPVRCAPGCFHRRGEAS